MDHIEKELEKSVAELEARVQVQPKTQTLKNIIENQIEILQLAQEKCLEKGLYDYIAPIAKTITDIIIQAKGYGIR